MLAITQSQDTVIGRRCAKRGVAHAAALRVFRVVLKSTSSRPSEENIAVVKVTRHTKHCIRSQKHRYSEHVTSRSVDNYRQAYSLTLADILN